MLGDSNTEVWVQFVREVAAGVVAVVGALAAYRWGVRRGEANGYHECEDCSRRVKCEAEQERQADDVERAVHPRKERRR